MKLGRREVRLPGARLGSSVKASSEESQEGFHRRRKGVFIASGRLMSQLSFTS